MCLAFNINIGHDKLLNSSLTSSSHRHTSAAKHLHCRINRNSVPQLAQDIVTSPLLE